MHPLTVRFYPTMTEFGHTPFVNLVGANSFARCIIMLVSLCE